MKKNLKKSSNRNPAPILLRKLLRLSGFALGFCIFLSLISLFGFGLPDGLTGRITDKLRDEGIPLQVQSIRLSIRRGWVLNRLRLYSPSPDDLQPLLSARKLYVSFRPDNWKDPFNRWRIGIYVRNASVSLGSLWEESLPKTAAFRTINRLDTSFTVEPGRVSISDLLLQWGGITLSAEGSALFPPGQETGEIPERLRRAATEAAEFLGRLEYDLSPRVEIRFHINSVRPEENRLDASILAEGICRNNHRYLRLSGDAGGRGSVWTLRELSLIRSAKEKLSIQGGYDAESGLAHLFIQNTLPASDLLDLLPGDLPDLIERNGVTLSGKLDFTATLGPEKAARLPETARIHVRHSEVSCGDLTLNPLIFHLDRRGSRLAFEDIQAESGSGPLTGRLEWDLTTEDWSVEAETLCDPAPVCALIDEDLYDFVKRFHFPETPARTVLTLSQSGKQPVSVSGTLSAERFTCGGVSIDHMETTLDYSNRILTLYPLRLRRDENRFDGDIQIDFPSDLAFFNAASSFSPSDVAKIIAPESDTFLNRIQFAGTVYAAGSGQVDYGAGIDHAFKGTFRAENIGLGSFHADLFDTAVEGRGTQLLFTRSAARLYNGTAEGSAEFDLLSEDGSAPYEISARFNQIDLARLIESLPGKAYGRTRGQLSGSIHADVDSEAAFWTSVRGRGQVEIREGHLADLPLFGGFSRLIQSALPTFSFFSLTEFSADYQLRNGAVYSDNAQFGGSLLSARGSGSYSPETGLDFSVMVQPLRQTGDGEKKWYQINRWAAKILKKGSSPFFRLLELRLEGPLERPEWRFVNLPRDVSDLLRRPWTQE